MSGRVGETPGYAEAPSPGLLRRPLPGIPGVSHSWRRAGDLQLHVAEAGEGEVLLLLHGFPENHYKWHRLIPGLSQRYRLLCPDLRGFGWSEAPPSGYDKETMARDMLALLDELGIERVRIAGHDWGGFIAMLIAMLAPARVERVLAMSVFLPFQRLTAGWVLSRWRTWHGIALSAPLLRRLFRPQSLCSGAVYRWLGSRAWTREECEVYLSQFNEAERRRAAVELYRAVPRLDGPRMLRGRYRQLGLPAPTLYVIGEADYISPRPDRSEYERYAPLLSAEVLPCGHALIEEHTEWLLDRCLQFFAEKS